jgi:hypothetical protein
MLRHGNRGTLMEGLILTLILLCDGCILSTKKAERKLLCTLHYFRGVKLSVQGSPSYSLQETWKNLILMEIK